MHEQLYTIRPNWTSPIRGFLFTAAKTEPEPSGAAVTLLGREVAGVATSDGLV
jgi:hypothetical protein